MNISKQACWICRQFLDCCRTYTTLSTDMRQNKEKEKQQNIISPAYFMMQLEQDQFLDNFCLNQTQKPRQPSSSHNTTKLSQEEKTFGSEKISKRKMASVRAREKKKKYVENLEQEVKILDRQIGNYDKQIVKCKQELLSAIHLSKSQPNEHSYTFGEMQKIVESEDPDMDRLNLLIDVLQHRIGANAKERQSNIEYYFKQIISSLFPALYRYLLHTAHHSMDCFQQNSEKTPSWTKELYQKLNLTPEQRLRINSNQDMFKLKYREAIKSIDKLKQVQQKLREQSSNFQRIINHIREDMTPIQSAKIALFGQKNKFRRQFVVFGQNIDNDQGSPRKKVKKIQ